MDDKDRVRERFVAQDGIGHGITQCIGCKYFEDFHCVKLDPQKAAIYIKNEKKCPYKEK